MRGPLRAGFHVERSAVHPGGRRLADQVFHRLGRATVYRGRRPRTRCHGRHLSVSEVSWRPGVRQPHDQMRQERMIDPKRSRPGFTTYALESGRELPHSTRSAAISDQPSKRVCARCLTLAVAPPATPLDTGRSAPIRGEGDDLREPVCRSGRGSAGADRVLRRRSARRRGRWRPAPRGWWLRRLGICLRDARGGVAGRGSAPSRHAHGERRRHAGHRHSCHTAAAPEPHRHRAEHCVTDRRNMPPHGITGRN